jgi:hypothetical protein
VLVLATSRRSPDLGSQRETPVHGAAWGRAMGPRGTARGLIDQPRYALQHATEYGDNRRVLPGQPVARSTWVRFRLIPPLMGSSRQALEARCYTRGLINKALL